MSAHEHGEHGPGEHGAHHHDEEALTELLEVIVGRAKLLTDRGLAIPADLTGACQAWEADGCTTALVAWDGQVRGTLALTDTVKPSAAPAVAALRALGLRPVLLTGDNEATALPRPP
jgi:P-type Cu+ transporter